MNREQRRKSNKSIKPIKTIKQTQSKDDLTLNKITTAINQKIKTRLIELQQDPQFSDLKHVQVNYFNISKLGIKYQNHLQRRVGMSYGDAVVKNTHNAPDQPEHYLCVNVFFDEDNLTAPIFQMLLGLTSKIHNWEYSEKDDIYIDLLGVYVDKLDFEKEANTDGKDK